MIVDVMLKLMALIDYSNWTNLRVTHAKMHGTSQTVEWCKGLEVAVDEDEIDVSSEWDIVVGEEGKKCGLTDLDTKNAWLLHYHLNGRLREEEQQDQADPMSLHS